MKISAMQFVDGLGHQVVAISFLFSASALALEPNVSDARAVARAVEDRDVGDRGTANATLKLVDQNGKERVRKLRQISMKFGQGRKTRMFFEAPADVRNTGFLSVDYDAGDKDDDQWLYLPSLHRSTRIAGADKSGSFMGSDLSYADMTKRDTSEYDYTLLEQSVVVDGEDCWLLESRPKSEAEQKETGYLKTHAWISKSKLVRVQVKAWVVEGKKIKYMKFGDLRRIDGIWVAHSLNVRTVRGTQVESTTVFELSDVKFNQPGVSDGEFAETRLEQGL
jgi:outer membrane lipoprotein-sorting protein